MIKLILQLIWHKASKRKWQIEIGAYLLRKGCPYEIGQVVKSKTLSGNQHKKAKYITGLTFDFGTNKIYKRFGNKVVSPKKSIWTRL